MSEQDPDDPKKPGGVKHDSRGNAVWQWAADTGRHAIDSTSRLLKRLDVPGLKIDEDDPPAKAPPLHKPGLAMAPDERDRKPRAPDPGGGYDPYGGMGGRVVKRPSQAAKQAASKPAASKPAASKPAAAGPGAAPGVRTPAAAPAPRPTLWQRLTGKR